MFSPRCQVAIFLSVALLPVGFVLTVQPSALASSEVDAVQYPLRHSFSLVPGLPGANRREPTSCWDSPDGQGYVCRIVSGVEETGDKQNFVVQAPDVLDNGRDPRFGAELVSRGGVAYEGCNQWRNGQYWFCDYQTREHVSRQHYQANGWVLNVFWNWARYTGDQVSCAMALSGVWSGIKGKGILLLLNDCKNGPM